MALALAEAWVAVAELADLGALAVPGAEVDLVVGAQAALVAVAKGLVEERVVPEAAEEDLEAVEERAGLGAPAVPGAEVDSAEALVAAGVGQVAALAVEGAPV